jgi:SNF2 family DNA or RNA helicase
MMDILGDFLKRENYLFSRVDGSTPVKNRTQIVDHFNKSKLQFIFLLSTKVFFLFGNSSIYISMEIN